jgi:hypothetical protein
VTTWARQAGTDARPAVDPGTWTLICRVCGRPLLLLVTVLDPSPEIRLEQIGDELFPYFADDPDRTAHPDDGRMEPAE